ncbi:MAG: hypothetical protein WDW38_009416 [Sanguina aurantia]
MPRQRQAPSVVAAVAFLKQQGSTAVATAPFPSSTQPLQQPWNDNYAARIADEAAKRVAAAASKELREGDGFTSAGRQIVFRRDANNQIIDTRPSGVDLNHTHLKIMTAAAGLEEVVAGDDQAVQFTYATSYTPTINGVRTPFKIQSLLDKFAVDENSRAHVTLSTYPLTKEKLNALRIKPDHALLSILFGR